MAKVTPEGKVKKQIRKVLDYFAVDGSLTYRMPVLTGFGKRDVDFYGCYRGLYFTIEAKAPGEDLTGLQRQRCVDVYKAGGRVFIISNQDGIYALAYWLGSTMAARRGWYGRTVQFVGGAQSGDSKPLS